MPPKASGPSKQGSKKADKKPQVTLDDFFTKFLYKKKRALNKKLQKIESLEQTPASELNEQQKELLTSKKENLDKLNYFDKIQDLYYEAYTTKDDVDEDGVAPAKSEKTPAPAPVESTPAAKQIDEKDIHKKNARSFAELVAVSSFFNHPHNREHYTKSHGSILKKFGNNFIDSVNSLWRSATELFETENQERTEEFSRIIENYLNKSDSLSSAANQTYHKLHEGVNALANEDAFKLSKHTAPPQPETKTLHAHPEETSARKGSEVKLVKNSKPASRKESRQIGGKGDHEEEQVEQKSPEAHHASHSPVEHQSPKQHQDFTKKPAQEIDPDEPQNFDSDWIPVTQGSSQNGRRGRGGRGGRGRGGRGEGRGEGYREQRGEDRGDGKGEGRHFRRDRDEDGYRPREHREPREPRDGEQGDREGGERRERREGGRGGRGRDGEPRQYDGERRERRGGYRGGDRGDRGDGYRRPRGDRAEGDRRPRDGDRQKDHQGAEGARTESTK